MKFSHSRSPRSRAWVTSALASAKDVASGFSDSTCLPVDSALAAHSRCRPVGSGRYTASTSSRSSSRSYPSMGSPPKRAANDSAFARSRLAIAPGRIAGTPAIAGNVRRHAMLAQPSTPTRTVSGDIESPPPEAVPARDQAARLDGQVVAVPDQGHQLGYGDPAEVRRLLDRVGGDDEVPVLRVVEPAALLRQHGVEEHPARIGTQYLVEVARLPVGGQVVVVGRQALYGRRKFHRVDEARLHAGVHQRVRYPVELGDQQGRETVAARLDQWLGPGVDLPVGAGHFGRDDPEVPALLVFDYMAGPPPALHRSPGAS